MAIKAGNQIDEEAIDERSKRRAKRKKKRTKIADNAQIESQTNADQEKDVDANQARLKCFTNYRPKVAVLWSVEHDGNIRLYGANFNTGKKRLRIDRRPRGCWRRFRFTDGNYSRQQTLERNTPRLPYTDVAKWIGSEETSKAFTIKIITTKLYIMNYGLAEEYVSDFEGDLQQKVDERQAAISDMIRIMAYDEGVSEEWRNIRLVCFWDVKSSRVICTHSELNTILEEIGILTLKWESGEKQEIFPWLYGEESTQSYSFLRYNKRLGAKSSFPRLPHPSCVLFVPSGFGEIHKSEMLRGIPLALLPEIYLDMLVCYNSTVWMEAGPILIGLSAITAQCGWKQDLGYKYCRTFFIKEVVKYMVEFGVDGRDNKKYCADPDVDPRKVDRETTKNKRSTKKKKTREN